MRGDMGTISEVIWYCKHLIFDALSTKAISLIFYGFVVPMVWGNAQVRHFSQLGGKWAKGPLSRSDSSCWGLLTREHLPLCSVTHNKDVNYKDPTWQKSLCLLTLGKKRVIYLLALILESFERVYRYADVDRCKSFFWGSSTHLSRAGDVTFIISPPHQHEEKPEFMK